MQYKKRNIKKTKLEFKKNDSKLGMKLIGRFNSFKSIKINLFLLKIVFTVIFKLFLNFIRISTVKNTKILSNRGIVKIM